jgi:hypothetical protein
MVLTFLLLYLTQTLEVVIQGGHKHSSQYLFRGEMCGVRKRKVQNGSVHSGPARSTEKGRSVEMLPESDGIVRSEDVMWSATHHDAEHMRRQKY